MKRCKAPHHSEDGIICRHPAGHKGDHLADYGGGTIEWNIPPPKQRTPEEIAKDYEDELKSHTEAVQRASAKK